MIRGIEFEVYMGEEVSGHWVGVADTLAEAQQLADEATRATRKTHAVVRVTRKVEGVFRFPDTDTP